MPKIKVLQKEIEQVKPGKGSKGYKAMLTGINGVKFDSPAARKALQEFAAITDPNADTKLRDFFNKDANRVALGIKPRQPFQPQGAPLVQGGGSQTPSDSKELMNLLYQAQEREKALKLQDPVIPVPLDPATEKPLLERAKKNDQLARNLLTSINKDYDELVKLAKAGKVEQATDLYALIKLKEDKYRGLEAAIGNDFAAAKSTVKGEIGALQTALSDHYQHSNSGSVYTTGVAAPVQTQIGKPAPSDRYLVDQATNLKAEVDSNFTVVKGKLAALNANTTADIPNIFALLAQSSAAQQSLQNFGVTHKALYDVDPTVKLHLDPIVLGSDQKLKDTFKEIKPLHLALMQGYVQDRAKEVVKDFPQPVPTDKDDFITKQGVKLQAAQAALASYKLIADGLEAPLKAQAVSRYKEVEKSYFEAERNLNSLKSQHLMSQIEAKEQVLNDKIAKLDTLTGQLLIDMRTAIDKDRVELQNLVLQVTKIPTKQPGTNAYAGVDPTQAKAITDRQAKAQITYQQVLNQIQKSQLPKAQREVQEALDKAKVGIEKLKALSDTGIPATDKELAEIALGMAALKKANELASSANINGTAPLAVELNKYNAMQKAAIEGIGNDFAALFDETRLEQIEKAITTRHQSLLTAPLPTTAKELEQAQEKLNALNALVEVVKGVAATDPAVVTGQAKAKADLPNFEAASIAAQDQLVKMEVGYNSAQVKSITDTLKQTASTANEKDSGADAVILKMQEDLAKAKEALKASEASLLKNKKIAGPELQQLQNKIQGMTESIAMAETAVKDFTQKRKDFVTPPPMTAPVTPPKPPRTGFDLIKEEGGVLGFVDDVVNETEIRKGYPTLPRQDETEALSLGGSPVYKGVLLQEGQVLRSAKPFFNDSSQPTKVTAVAIIQQERNGRVVDKSMGPMTPEQQSESAMRQAQMLLQNYDTSKGEIIIRGKDPEKANKVFAALLLIQQSDPRLAGIKIKSWVPGCTGPESRFYRTSGGDVNAYINTHLHESVRVAQGQQKSKGAEVGQSTVQALEAKMNYRDKMSQMRAQQKPITTLEHDDQLTHSGNVKKT